MYQYKGITIHNTGNDKSADELFKLLKDNNKLNYCHFLVDDNKIIQTVSLEERSYHTGKGFDNGNLNTIAIEICRSTCNDELYMKAQNKSVELIKRLLSDYGLQTKDIYFHRDFNSNIYCPHRILKMYGNKNNFIKEVFNNGN